MRILFTGGTFAGKTSLLKRFEADGFNTVSDVGLEIINTLNDELGMEKQRQYRKEHSVDFYNRIIDKQLALEGHTDSAITIFDRGAYDYIAMMQLEGTSASPALTRKLEGLHYDIVFVFDTLKDFNERQSTGRYFSKDDSYRLNEYVSTVYKDLGFRIIIVEEMPLQDRYEFVLNEIQEASEGAS